MDPQTVSPGQVSVTTTQPGGYSMGPPPPVNHHTTVVVNQPVQMSHVGPRVWSSDMCSCFDDVGSCLLGTFCPMILACQLSSNMGESACVPCCVPGSMIVLRTKMRTEQNIQGSVMDDCCVVTFCGLCATCQMSRELDYIQRMQQ